MQRPLYIDWLVEEKGKVIKDSVPLTCYKVRLLDRGVCFR